MYKKGDLVTIGPDHENGLFIIVGQEATLDTMAGPLWLCAPLDMDAQAFFSAIDCGPIEMAERWLRMESSID